MKKEFAELIGIIIGDGNLSNIQNHYRIGITSGRESRNYMEFICDLVQKVWNKKPKIMERGRGLYITISSKEIFLELTKNYNFPIGDGKCEKIAIPNKILNDWNNARHTIRGIADTDGSIFTANKPESPCYPSIEITTTSIELANQLKIILEKNGFKVAKIWSNQREGNRTAYKVALNGKKNVEKWMDQIGFSHPLKKNKAENILVNKYPGSY